MRPKKIMLSAACCLLFVALTAGCREKAKEPAVSGSFYPSDEKVLRKTVSDFLANAKTGPLPGRLIALISPHAGYQYSGQVAAYSYNQLVGKNIKTVILIGPSHHESFYGASVYAEGAMKTPMGNVKIDGQMARELINEKAGVIFYPKAFEKEHSLEVQLPFLQQTLKDFRVVPVLIGSPTKESFRHLAEKLTELLRKNNNTIIIASTDLSHFHDYDTALKLDGKIMDAVERISLKDTNRLLYSGEGEMCGGYPVLLIMDVAARLGATNGILYKYANSGNITGDKGRVVGYAAMGLYKSDLTAKEKADIISLAKKAIIDYVTYKKIPNIDPRAPRLKADSATFVTIKTRGNLRGCIGNVFPSMPLYKSVISNAVSACSKDPRFPPMSKQELKDIDVEVSVLSPMEPLADIKDIKIGRHGLLLVKGQSSGLLLPQVPSEFGWDTNAFLENLSLKAGLPKDSWKGAKLYTFTAEIIKQ